MQRRLPGALVILPLLIVSSIRPAGARAETGAPVVYLQDEAGHVIATSGACVTVWVPPQGGAGDVCDGDPVFDAAPRSGIVEIQNLVPGERKVGGATPPTGYHWNEDFTRGYAVTGGRETGVVLTLVADATVAGGSGGDTTRSDTASCKLVELYPGYPGYKGYVTGVDGIGDHACLQDLEASSSSFDRADEDAANVEAAGRIGLNGGPEDWTWENWMAIEGERGLPPTCYSCAFAGAAARSEPMGTSVDPDDPRLVLGTFGTTVAVNRYVTEYHNPSLTNLIPYDHVLRAMAYLVAPSGRHLNAPELVSMADALVESLRNTYYDPDQFWDRIVEQGGYVPTPETAAPEDQVFMIIIGAAAMCGWMPHDACFSFQQSLDRQIQAWKESQYTGSDLGFGAWLRQNHASQRAAVLGDSASQSAPVNKPTQTETWVSPQFGFRVNWSAPWVEGESESVSGSYDQLVLSSGALSVVTYAAYTEWSVTEFLDQVIDDRRAAYSGVDVVQEVTEVDGSAGAFPLILTYTNTTGQLVEEAAYPNVLTPGESIMLLSYRYPSDTSTEVRQQLFPLVDIEFDA